MMPNSSPIYLEVENIFAIGAEQQSRRKSSAGIKADPLNYTNRALFTFVDAVGKMNEAVLVPSRLRDIEVREVDANDLMSGNSDLYSYFQMLNTAKQDLFSSTSYQTAFQPGVGANGISSNNSGASSGRVTPTTLSRRSSMYGGGPGFGGTSSPNGLNGTSSPRNLMPPSMFERKLSGTFENGNNNSNNNGSISPERDLQQQVSSLLPGVGLTVPLTYGVNRPPSLNSLLVTAGLDVPEGEVVGIDERVSSISACFMHHLTALYTILGHFTRAANYITRRYQEETEDAGVLGN